MKNVLLYIWQLPQNLFGLVLIVLCNAGHAKSDVYEDSRIWSTNRFGGISLGRYIIIHDRYYRAFLLNSNLEVIKHEYGHCRQSKMLGPAYLFIIGIPSLTHNVLHQIGIAKGNYYKYWCERWADRLGDVKRN